MKVVLNIVEGRLHQVQCKVDFCDFCTPVLRNCWSVVHGRNVFLLLFIVSCHIECSKPIIK